MNALSHRSGVEENSARGRELHFYLAGINNQNFLMRDRETGSWWQQVTGRAIAGPLAGSTLELMPNDELTFALWKSESPHGLVLAPVAGHEKDYDERVGKGSCEVSGAAEFSRTGSEGSRRRPGDLEMDGQARAFPLANGACEQSPVEDKVAGVPVALVTGPDGESVRVFRSQWNGMDIELYRDSDKVTAMAEWHR